MDDLDFRAAKIRLVCTDIDGVLTNGGLHYGREPGHTKVFHVRDGAAIKWLQRAGIPVAFISGLASPATRHRAEDLGVADCYAGHLDKQPVLDELCAKYGLGYDQVAHLGDDLPDLPLLRRVGLACCPEDAAPEVRDVITGRIPAELQTRVRRGRDADWVSLAEAIVVVDSEAEATTTMVWSRAPFSSSLRTTLAMELRFWPMAT